MAKWKRSGADALREYEQSSNYVGSIGVTPLNERSTSEAGGKWKRSGADALREYEQSSSFPQTLQVRKYNAEDRNYDQFAAERYSAQVNAQRRDTNRHYQEQVNAAAQAFDNYRRYSSSGAAKNAAYQNYEDAKYRQELARQQMSGKRLTESEKHFLENPRNIDPDRAAREEAAKERASLPKMENETEEMRRQQILGRQSEDLQKQIDALTQQEEERRKNTSLWEKIGRALSPIRSFRQEENDAEDAISKLKERKAEVDRQYQMDANQYKVYQTYQKSERPEAYTAENVGNYKQRLAALASVYGTWTKEQEQEAKEAIGTQSGGTGLLSAEKNVWAFAPYQEAVRKNDTESARQWEQIYNALYTRLYSGQEAVTSGLMQGLGFEALGDVMLHTSTEMADEAYDRWAEQKQNYAYAQSEHPYLASGARIAGSLALMSGVGKAAGAGLAATGLKTGSFWFNVARGSLTFAGVSAIQNSGAAASGDISGGDYLKSIAVSGAQGAAGNIAGELVGSGLATVLRKNGLMTPFFEFVRQTASSMSNATVNQAIGYAAADKKPTGQEIAEGLVTSFLFSALSSAISTYETTNAQKARMQQAYNQIESSYQAMAAGTENMTPEAKAQRVQLILQQTQNLRAATGEYYIAGQQKAVNNLNSALDAIEDWANNYLNGYQAAADAMQPKTALPGGTTGQIPSAPAQPPVDPNLTQEVANGLQTAITQGVIQADTPQPMTGGDAAAGAAQSISQDLQAQGLDAKTADALVKAATEMQQEAASAPSGGQNAAPTETVAPKQNTAQTPAQDAQESTAVNTNPAEHTKAEQAVIEAYKASADGQMRGFIEKVRSLQNNDYKNKISADVHTETTRAADTAGELTGTDTSGFKNIIKGNAVQHIDRRHGANGSADHSLANIDDFSRIGFVLDNFTDAELLPLNRVDAETAKLSREWMNSDNTQAPLVRFSMPVNGVFYVVEAVPSSKAKRLAVVSAYISRENKESTLKQVLNLSDTTGSGTPETPLAILDAPEKSLAQNGGTVKQTDASTLSSMAQTLGKSGQKAIFKAYDSKADTAEYAGEFVKVYNAARAGNDLPETKTLEPWQKYAAEVAGKNDMEPQTAQEIAAVKPEQTSGQTTEETPFKPGLDYSDYVKAAVRDGEMTTETAQQIDTVAKQLGVRVRFADEVAGGTANAELSGNEVLIEKHNNNPVMFLLGHELTHRIQETAPEQYQQFREAIMDEIRPQAQIVMENYAQRGYEITEEAALDEAAADYAGRMIDDGEVLDDFIEKHRDDRTLLQKIIDAIRSFIRKLTGAERKKAETAEGKLLAAMDAAAENTKTAASDGGTRYSAKSGNEGREATQAEITTRYQQSVHDILNGASSSSDALLVGYTPEVYQKLGMPDLPFVVGGGHVYSMAKTADEASAEGKFHKGVNYHGLGENVVADILDFVKDPVMVISAKDVDAKTTPMRSTHSVVALIDVGTGKESMVIPVAITAERTVNGMRMDVNAISSAYEKNTAGLVNEAIAQFNAGENSVFYVKKGAANLLGAGVQFPEQLKAAASSDGIVRKFDSKINMSVQNVTESQQFKRWFGDWQNHPERASKVVNADGTPKVVYHGTNAAFNTFRQENGVYFFSESRDYAESMAEERGGTRVVEAYLSIRNPLYVRMQERSFTDPTQEARYIRQAKSEGRDGVVFVLDSGNELVDDTFYAAFMPEQIKSATDNVGTFDRNNPDIRYSVKGAEVSREYADVLKENELLKERVDYWKGQTKQTQRATTDEKAVGKEAKSIIKRYGAELDAADIQGDLQSLYDAMANGELDGKEAFSQAKEIAGKLVENAVEADDELYQSYKDLRNFLRTTKLTISEEDGKNVPDLAELRKQNFGRMTIGKGQTNVDQVYQELADQWPEFFDEDEYTHPADQLQQIADVLGNIYTITEQNPYQGYMEQAKTAAANEILDDFFELPQTRKSFADRQAAALSEAKAKGKAQAQKVREQKNAQLADLREKNRARVNSILEKERTRRADQINKLKEQYKSRDTAAKDRREARELRNKIIRHTKGLSQKLLRPTDKQHIPEILKHEVAAMLESINMEDNYTLDPATIREGKVGKDGKTTLYGEKLRGADRNEKGVMTRRSEAFEALKAKYTQIVKDGDAMTVDPYLLGDNSEGIRGGFDEVIAMKDTPLADLSKSQLQTVWNVVRAVEHSVSTYGKMLSNAKYAQTRTWAEAIRNDVSERRPIRKRTTRLTLDLETPYTFFSHYGDSGKAIYRMLRDAQDQQQLIVDRITEETQKIVDPKTVKQLEKQTHTFQTASGKTLTLTTAQAMEIYNLMQRKQALEHLTTGGIIQPEIKSAKIGRGFEAIRLTEADLQQIAGSLTAEQVKIADGLQGMTTGLLADYGNDASMRAYGYKKFTEKNYWPIRSAREGVQSTVEKGGNQPRSIQNVGLAKPLTPGANNPLDIPGIFTTFANHAAEMTDYAAWLCTMEDVNHLFNYQFRDENGLPTGRNIRQILDEYGGRGAQSYWRSLMDNIQNGINLKEFGPMTDFAGKAISGFKGAAVGGNIRVVIQQPTAFFRAAAVLDPADMAKGLVKGVKGQGGWSRALEYSPIAMRKDNGGFDISAPYTMKETLFDTRTAVRKLNDTLSAPAGAADAVTWGRLWNACEWTVHRENPYLEPGSKAFYEQTAKQFAEVIDQTQVVDGVLQRSNIMRNKGEIAKQATSFMGEPIMSLNLLIRSWDNIRYEQEPRKRSKAIKTFGRAVMALVVTAAVNAMAQSLIDAIRDDEPDKDYKERYLTAFTGISGDEETTWQKAWNAVMEGNLGGNLNYIGNIPYVKDFLSLLQGYEVNRMDTEVVGDLVDAGKMFVQNVDGNGTKTSAYAVKSLLGAASKVYGVPVNNLTRDLWGMVRSVAVETKNIPVQYEMEKAIYNITNNKNKSRYIGILYRALEQGDVDSFQHIRSDLMNTMGLDGAEIDASLRSRYDNAVKKDPSYTLPLAARDLIGSRDKYKEETTDEKFSAKDLNETQYRAYSDQRGTDYREIEDALKDSDTYQSLDAKTRSKLIDAAYDLVEQQSLEDHSDGQYEITTKWMTLADDAEKIGIEPYMYVTFHVVYNTTESTKGSDGKAVKGQSKSDKIRKWLKDNRDLTEQQRKFLWEAVYESDW